MEGFKQTPEVNKNELHEKLGDKFDGHIRQIVDMCIQAGMSQEDMQEIHLKLIGVRTEFMEKLN